MTKANQEQAKVAVLTAKERLEQIEKEKAAIELQLAQEERQEKAVMLKEKASKAKAAKAAMNAAGMPKDMVKAAMAAMYPRPQGDQLKEKETSQERKHFGTMIEFCDVLRTWHLKTFTHKDKSAKEAPKEWAKIEYFANPQNGTAQAYKAYFDYYVSGQNDKLDKLIKDKRFFLEHTKAQNTNMQASLRKLHNYLNS